MHKLEMIYGICHQDNPTVILYNSMQNNSPKVNIEIE